MNDPNVVPQDEATGLTGIIYENSWAAPTEGSTESGGAEKHSSPAPAPKKLVIAGYLLAAAALFVIFAGIKAAQTIVGPFCLACFLAMILAAPLRWLKSKGLSDVVASLVISAGVLICGLSIIWILAGSVNQFIARIPHYTARFNETLENVDDFLEPHGFSLLGGPKEAKKSPIMSPTPGDNPPDNLQTEHLQDETEEDDTQEMAQTLPVRPAFSFDETFTPQEQAEINTVGIAGYVRWAAMELGRLGALCFIVMILVVFMMIEASRLPKKLLSAFGTQGITNEHLQNIAEKVWKYMKIKSIISFFVGFFVWLLLIFTGVEYAMLWGLLAFFLNFIPNIGSIIAAVPGVALALFDHGVGICIIVTIGYLAINQTLGYYIEPIFLGDRLGISPLVVLLSLIFWGWLLGLIGMFLSAPLTIVVKIVLDSFNETRWVSRLMDDK